MTIDANTYASTLKTFLEAVAFSDDEGSPEAQTAKWLLDHIGAITGPEPAALDRQLLEVFAAQQYAVRLAEAWAQERTRQNG